MLRRVQKLVFRGWSEVSTTVSVVVLFLGLVKLGARDLFLALRLYAANVRRSLPREGIEKEDYSSTRVVEGAWRASRHEKRGYSAENS